MEEAGVARYCDRFYFFRRGDDVYMYDDILDTLYSEDPVEYFKIIEETSYKVVLNSEKRCFRGIGRHCVMNSQS